ncbi:MAG: hypothetical protein LC772_12700 [Chloroflexi bacterium]|nr:hypothetical protein [Chloroflexota bacterium]
MMKLEKPMAAVSEKIPTSLFSDLLETTCDDDLECRTTIEVRDTVLTLLREAAGRMVVAMPEGSVSSDAMNGIRIQWDRNDRHVVLAVPADLSRRRYIYASSSAGSESYALASTTLADLLTWLARGA